MVVEYKDDTVYVAARKRIAAVFDEFDRIVVSVSSGKDSTALYYLCLWEAERRGRRIDVFFLDQEAEYQASIDVIGDMMRHPAVNPLWMQVPLYLTNATSHESYFLYGWGPGEEWMRPKDPIAIHRIEGDYPQRFYEFFPWQEQQVDKTTAWLVGLRSKESFNRFRAVTKNPGHQGWSWSTKTKTPLSFRFYPLYDWTFGDVWRCIVDHDLPYNRHYDRMYAKHGVNMSKMRVSNLVHEKSFRCLADLQEFEPDTYDRLLKRLAGVHAGALYAREGSVFDAKSLPDAFESWRQFRDYLLATTPIDKVDRYRKRFAGQSSDEETYRQQCKQVLINDWENSVPVRPSCKSKLRERWWDVL